MLDKRAAAKASAFLAEYSIEKGIYLKINYFNADHPHALIDLPTRNSIEEVIKLKGGSSYWINHSQIIKGKFASGGGYGLQSLVYVWLITVLTSATFETRFNRLEPKSNSPKNYG